MIQSDSSRSTIGERVVTKFCTQLLNRWFTVERIEGNTDAQFYYVSQQPIDVNLLMGLNYSCNEYEN